MEEVIVTFSEQSNPADSAPQTKQHHPLIQLRQVYKVYETIAGDFPALRGINADVQRGEFLGVIGKSGAGKSTLLNMITGTTVRSRSIN